MNNIKNITQIGTLVCGLLLAHISTAQEQLSDTLSFGSVSKIMKIGPNKVSGVLQGDYRIPSININDRVDKRIIVPGEFIDNISQNIEELSISLFENREALLGTDSVDFPESAYNTISSLSKQYKPISSQSKNTKKNKESSGSIDFAQFTNQSKQLCDSINLLVSQYLSLSGDDTFINQKKELDSLKSTAKYVQDNYEKVTSFYQKMQDNSFARKTKETLDSIKNVSLGLEQNIVYTSEDIADAETKIHNVLMSLATVMTNLGQTLDNVQYNILPSQPIVLEFDMTQLEDVIKQIGEQQNDQNALILQATMQSMKKREQTKKDEVGYQLSDQVMLYDKIRQNHIQLLAMRANIVYSKKMLEGRLLGFVSRLNQLDEALELMKESPDLEQYNQIISEKQVLNQQIAQGNEILPGIKQSISAIDNILSYSTVQSMNTKGQVVDAYLGYTLLKYGFISNNLKRIVDDINTYMNYLIQHKMFTELELYKQELTKKIESTTEFTKKMETMNELKITQGIPNPQPITPTRTNIYRFSK